VTASGRSAGGTNGLTVAIAARDPLVRRALVAALAECRIRGIDVMLEGLARLDEKANVVCADSSAAASVLALNVPTVIVTRGASLSDEVWALLSQRRPVILRYVDLTPITLLEGLLTGYFGVGLGHAPASLGRLPPRLLRAFLAESRSIHTLGDLARGAGFSVGNLRALERDLGVPRFEGLLARLRAETWKWLVAKGVDRRVVEDYLGIADRSNFRRACRRAGIPVPWDGKT
jgi:hypothetical protein